MPLPMGNQPWFECFASLLDIELSTGIESMHYLEQTCFDSCRYTPSSSSSFTTTTSIYLASYVRGPYNYLEESEHWSVARTRKSWNKRVENNSHFIIMITTQAISRPCMMGYP